MQKYYASLFVSASLLGSAAANAAMPAAITTAATDITTNVQGMFDLFLPVVALSVGLGIVVSLFKKYGKKAI